MWANSRPRWIPPGRSSPGLQNRSNRTGTRRRETSADAAKTFADVMERLRALDDGVARVTDAVQRTTESSKALEKRFDGFLGVLRQIPS